MLAFALLLSAPFLAHVIGALTARALTVEPGRIRDWMPSTTDDPAAAGDFTRRWLRRRQVVERRLLERFAGGVTGAEATTLAGELGEQVSLVQSALAHLREEIPCRLRVTRQGRLLHDFAAGDIAALRWRRRAQRPSRVGIFVLAALANVGAAWPILAAIAVALLTLGEMWGADDAVSIGLWGLAGLAGLIGATWLLGRVMRWILRPIGWGPRIGDQLRPEAGRGAGRAGSERSHFAFPRAEKRNVIVLTPRALRGSKAKRKSSSSSSFDLDGVDDPRGIVVAIIVVVLIGVVAVCTFAFSVWLRGMWRAATRRDEAPPGTAPATWIRESHPVDKQERLLPTNDLVMRMMRGLRRTVAQTHPRDARMAGRILAAARDRGGRISALEITLLEGVDPAEAAAIGTELCAHAEGDTDITDQGELVFRFPEAYLARAAAEPDHDRGAEYLALDGLGVRRRESQPPDALPVNLPGVGYGHLVATDHLVAGTILMALSGFVAVFESKSLLWLEPVAELLLPLMVVGTFALVGATRYAVRALAVHGVRRDARRAAFAAVERALGEGSRTVDSTPITRAVQSAFSPAWRSVDERLLQREVEAVFYDLDLDVDEGVGRAWSLVSLRERLAALAEHRSAPWRVASGEDEVIFDTAVEHDRVRVLA